MTQPVLAPELLEAAPDTVTCKELTKAEMVSGEVVSGLLLLADNPWSAMQVLYPKILFAPFGFPVPASKAVNGPALVLVTIPGLVTTEEALA